MSSLHEFAQIVVDDRVDFLDLEADSFETEAGRVFKAADAENTGPGESERSDSAKDEGLLDRPIRLPI